MALFWDMEILKQVQDDIAQDKYQNAMSAFLDENREDRRTGDHSKGVPLDPIPNSTVKPFRAYDTLS